jgi:hypothetical protein
VKSWRGRSQFRVAPDKRLTDFGRQTSRNWLFYTILVNFPNRNAPTDSAEEAKTKAAAHRCMRKDTDHQSSGGWCQLTKAGDLRSFILDWLVLQQSEFVQNQTRIIVEKATGNDPDLDPAEIAQRMGRRFSSAYREDIHKFAIERFKHFIRSADHGKVYGFAVDKEALERDDVPGFLQATLICIPLKSPERPACCDVLRALRQIEKGWIYPNADHFSANDDSVVHFWFRRGHMVGEAREADASSDGEDRECEDFRPMASWS